MNLPSREQCEDWDQEQVVLFLYKNKMPECVSTVNRLKIDGQRLLNLSDSDLSRFSLIHQPQLQKIVHDIKKNDGSLLNKLKRLKGRPVPKLPARDYRDREDEDEESDPEYDNDTYEDPHDDQDNSYEPPPAHRVFSATPTSFSRGEYLDSCRNRPQRPPRKPHRPDKASKQLPPTPPHSAAHDDYVSPDDNNDDDYVEPEEQPPTHNIQHPKRHVMSKTMRDRPLIPTPTLERPPSPDFYEVPDKEENTPAPPPNRLRPVPTTPSPSLPPKPAPRPNPGRCHMPVQETTEDEYEVCDPDDGCNDKPAEGRLPALPRPLPRERSPKPPVRPKPESKPREFESRMFPVINPEPSPTPPKGYSLDQKRPKIPLPHFTSHRQNDRGSVSAENGFTDQDKDADVCRKPWYAGTCDRKTADDALFRCNQDGGFLVRKSSGQDAQQPFTLVVFYKSRVYNIPIRYIPNTKQYALGREKKGEEHFSNVSHIIDNHQRIPLVLIDSQSNTKDSTKLCLPVKP